MHKIALPSLRNTHPHGGGGQSAELRIGERRGEQEEGGRETLRPRWGGGGGYIPHGGGCGGLGTPPALSGGDGWGEPRTEGTRQPCRERREGKQRLRGGGGLPIVATGEPAPHRTAPRTGPGTRPRLRRSAAPSPRPAAAPERCPRPRSPTARARPAQPRVGLRASHPPHRPPKPLTPCLSPGSFVVGAGTGKPLAPRLLFPRPPPPPPHAFGWEMPGTAEHRCPHPPPAPAPERAQEQSK